MGAEVLTSYILELSRSYFFRQRAESGFVRGTARGATWNWSSSGVGYWSSTVRFVVDGGTGFNGTVPMWAYVDVPT